MQKSTPPSLPPSFLHLQPSLWVLSPSSVGTMSSGMARLVTRKLGATLRALTFQRDSIISPYCGGYDIHLTYGNALPPSDDICYPISPTHTGQGSYGGDTRDNRFAPPPMPQPDRAGGNGFGGGGGTKIGLKPVGGLGYDDEYRYGYGGRKEEEAQSWEYEYGYGGRRLRDQEVHGDNQEGVIKLRKKEKGREKVSYGGGGDDDIGGGFGRAREELYRKQGGEGKFQKPTARSDVFPYGNMQEEDVAPRSQGAPTWTSDYGYGGRRVRYQESEVRSGESYDEEEEHFKKKRYAETSMQDFQGRRYGSTGSKDGRKREGSYDGREEKYGYNYAGKKPGEEGKPSHGRVQMGMEEDGRNWQGSSSRETKHGRQDYLDCKFIDDSEEEWMRKRNKRRARP